MHDSGGNYLDTHRRGEAPSPVYGENNVQVRYRVMDLIWRPVAHLVRFVMVHHPHRGTIFLLCTDLTLEPMEILQLYGLYPNGTYLSP